MRAIISAGTAIQLGVKQKNKNDKNFIKISFLDQETLNQYRSKFENPSLSAQASPNKEDLNKVPEQIKSPSPLAIQKQKSSASTSSKKVKKVASSTPSR